MKHVLLATTLLTAPFAVLSGAQAEAVNGLYIGAGAGVNFLQDQRYDSGATGPFFVTNPRPRNRFDAGGAAVASIGYGLGNGLRVELEGNYRYNHLRGEKGGRANIISEGGREEKYGAMVNALYDFDPNVLGLGFVPFPVTPYVGVGAGYQWTAFKSRTTAVDQFGPINSQLGGTQGSFAYQGIVGAAFPISAVPGLSVTAEYRFLGLAEDRSYGGPAVAPATAATVAAVGRRTARFTDGENYNHSLMLGVRYAFNAAPPAPPPVPVAPAVRSEARTYLVFFDWDRADLTDRARQIIAEAAQATTRTQVTRIEVAGHTDSSGTAQYNQGLSDRRAQNVAAELVRLGVPRAAIDVQGFGQSRPLVQTAQGVREPQNRRVEIILR